MGIFDSSSKSVGMSPRYDLKPREELSCHSSQVETSVKVYLNRRLIWSPGDLPSPSFLPNWKQGSGTQSWEVHTLKVSKLNLRARTSLAKCTLNPWAQTVQKHKGKLRWRSVMNEIKTEKTQPLNLAWMRKQMPPASPPTHTPVIFYRLLCCPWHPEGWIPGCLWWGSHSYSLITRQHYEYKAPYACTSRKW